MTTPIGNLQTIKYTDSQNTKTKDINLKGKTFTGHKENILQLSITRITDKRHQNKKSNWNTE